jgi:hypothetical protein
MPLRKPTVHIVQYYPLALSIPNVASTSVGAVDKDIKVKPYYLLICLCMSQFVKTD